MYLRYRLDEQGKRVYTFKVSSLVFDEQVFDHDVWLD